MTKVKKVKEPGIDRATAARRALAVVSVEINGGTDANPDIDCHTLREVLAAGFSALEYTRSDVHADTMISRLLEEYGPRPRVLGLEYRGAVVGRFYSHHDRGGAYELIDIDEKDAVLRDTRLFHGTLLVETGRFLTDYRNEDASPIEEDLPELDASELASFVSDGNEAILIHMPTQKIVAVDIGTCDGVTDARQKATLLMRRELKDWKRPASTIEVVNAALTKIERPTGITAKQWEFIKAGARSLAGAISNELAKDK